MVLLTNKSCRHFEKDTVAHFNFRFLYVRHYLRTPQRRINNFALVQWLEPIVNQHLLYASFAMGGLVSILSNVFNNHPALMIGTITLTEMGLIQSH